MKKTTILIMSILFLFTLNVNALVLYENGPMITSIGTGTNGEDESVLQFSGLGMILRGFSNQSHLDNRLADDFIIQGNNWHIDTITFYTFVTGATVPTVTEIYLQIWDGIPNQVGSNILFGDLVTNRLNNSVNTHILRVIEADSGTSDERQITANITDVNITLPAGTYWLDWSTNGTDGLGPYAPPIAITGQLTTGNALQFNNDNQWEDANDFGTNTQQGFPFIIENDISDLIFYSAFEANP